jgi:hypothetical protein
MTSLPYDIHDNPTYLAAQMADYAFTGVVKGDSVYCLALLWQIVRDGITFGIPESANR